MVSDVSLKNFGQNNDVLEWKSCTESRRPIKASQKRKVDQATHFKNIKSFFNPKTISIWYYNKLSRYFTFSFSFLGQNNAVLAQYGTETRRPIKAKSQLLQHLVAQAKNSPSLEQQQSDFILQPGPHWYR